MTSIPAGATIARDGQPTGSASALLEPVRVN